MVVSSYSTSASSPLLSLWVLRKRSGGQYLRRSALSVLWICGVFKLKHWTSTEIFEIVQRAFIYKIWSTMISWLVLVPLRSSWLTNESRRVKCLLTQLFFKKQPSPHNTFKDLTVQLKENLHVQSTVLIKHEPGTTMHCKKNKGSNSLCIDLGTVLNGYATCVWGTTINKCRWVTITCWSETVMKWTGGENYINVFYPLKFGQQKADISPLSTMPFVPWDTHLYTCELGLADHLTVVS